MAVRRETNPEFVNRIANSDSVRPFIRPDGEPVDLTPAVEMPLTQSGCVVLSNGEDAVAIFELTAPRVYQSHILFAKTCRGRRAIDTAREMVGWMFDHGAVVVWGSTPRDNRKVRWFSRQIGAVPLSTSDETHENFEIRKSESSGQAPTDISPCASMIIEHHDPTDFLATVPVSNAFREFVRTAKPLTGPDRAPEIVILSNGIDTAVAFAYRARRSWQMIAESRPWVSIADMATTVRSMLERIFDQGADSVVCFARAGDDRWRHFHWAIGARCLQQVEDQEIFEITRRTQ